MARAKLRAPQRTYPRIFLDKLEDLSGEDRSAVGNKRLTTALGWSPDRYKKVKKGLVEQNLIEVRRGKGGAVRLLSPAKAGSIDIFISYSHLDEKFKDELIKHLEPLRKDGLVTTWNDRKLTAGAEWDKTISGALESADVILILVSIDFINSAYCYDKELGRALELHEEGKTTVIPVILRSCLWSKAPFAKLQALPKDAKAVATWNDRDEALMDVAEGIRRIAEEKLGRSRKP